MIRRLDFAPLDGITRSVFRRVWARRFGGADRIFVPFFSPTHHRVVTQRDLREITRQGAELHTSRVNLARGWECRAV